MSDDLERDGLRFSAADELADHLQPIVSGHGRRRRSWQLLSATATLVVVTLVVVWASVVGGGSTRQPASGLSAQLTGARWSLDSITTAGARWAAPAGNGFSLGFTATGYTGNDSCNGTSGSVSYGPGTVHLGPGAMTELGCIGADQDRMQTAFRLLIDTDLPASVSGSALTLTAGQTVFALSRVQPAVPVDLSKVLPGTTWTLVSIAETGADVSSSSTVPANVAADIAFRTRTFRLTTAATATTGRSRTRTTW